MGFNIWHEFNELESIATRHKRASSLKQYLLTDLKMIEKKIKELRKEWNYKEEVESCKECKMLQQNMVSSRCKKHEQKDIENSILKDLRVKCRKLNKESQE